VNKDEYKFAPLKLTVFFGHMVLGNARQPALPESTIEDGKVANDIKGRLKDSK